MGAITGAAEGAIAGPEGAVAGAVAGHAAAARKKKEDRAAQAGDRVGSAAGRGIVSAAGHSGMKMLMAEFLICIVVLGLSPLGSAPSADSQDGTATDTSGALAGAGSFMLKGTATFGVFLVLGMAAAIGPNIAKYAAGVGGLMTLAVLFNAANSFSGIVDGIKSAKAPSTEPTPAPAPAPNAYSPDKWTGAGDTSKGTTPQTQTDPTTGDITGLSSGIGGVPANTAGLGRFGT